MSAVSPESAAPPSKKGRGACWIRTFHDKYDWMGPVMAVLGVWYFVAQIVVGWVFNPGHAQYSFIANTISDLGNTACGPYGGSYVCSPRYVVMDVSFAVLGLAMLVGSLLIYSEFTKRAFRERVAGLIAFVLLAIGGLGAILVGSFPENTNGVVHAIGAAMAIVAGNVGILVLGFVLLSIPEGLRHFMLFAASVSLVAALAFGLSHYFGLGTGGMERIAAYPESVWLIMFGIYMTRDHYLSGSAKRLRRQDLARPDLMDDRELRNVFAFDGSDVTVYPSLRDAESGTGVYALGRLVFFADDGSILVASHSGQRVRLVRSGRRDPAGLDGRLATYLAGPKVGLDPSLAANPKQAAREISQHQWDSPRVSDLPGSTVGSMERAR